VGVFLEDIPATSIDDCKRECQTYEGVDTDGDGEPDKLCSFFTFDSLTQACKLLDGCERVTDSCSTCISGSVNCGSKHAPNRKGKNDVDF